MLYPSELRGHYAKTRNTNPVYSLCGIWNTLHRQGKTWQREILDETIAQRMV